MKLEISNKKKLLENVEIKQYTLEQAKGSKKKSKGEFDNILRQQNTTSQNLWDKAKAIQIRKFIEMNIYNKKEEFYTSGKQKKNNLNPTLTEGKK